VQLLTLPALTAEDC